MTRIQPKLLRRSRSPATSMPGKTALLRPAFWPVRACTTTSWPRWPSKPRSRSPPARTTPMRPTDRSTTPTSSSEFPASSLACPITPGSWPAASRPATRATSTPLAWLMACIKTMRSSRTRSSARSSPCSSSPMRTRRCAGPTALSSGWRPRSGRQTTVAQCGCPRAWTSAASGSTPTSRWWPRCHMGASSTPGTARTFPCTGSTTTRGSSTSCRRLTKSLHELSRRIQQTGGLVADRPARLSSGCLASAATRAVEARSGQTGPSNVRPVRAAAAGVSGVEPLREELAKPCLASRAVHRQPVLERRLQLRLGDVPAPVSALHHPQGEPKVPVAKNLAQGDVGSAWAVVGVGEVEQQVGGRVRRCGRPEAAALAIHRFEGAHQTLLEGCPARRRARSACSMFGLPGREQELCQRCHALLEERHRVAALGHVVAPPLVHVLVVQHVGIDSSALEGDHRFHLLLEGGLRQADDDPVGAERIPAVKPALEPGDARLQLHDCQVLGLLPGANRAVLHFVELDATDDVRADLIVADAVLD